MNAKRKNSIASVCLAGYFLITAIVSMAEAQGTPISSTNEIMSWVPPYSLDVSRAAANLNLGNCNPKDVITRVGLQFWLVNANGSIEYDAPRYTVSDNEVSWWRNWGTTNNIKMLLCINNADETGWNWPRAQGGFITNRSKFVKSLIDEMTRLNLDGIDVDLEGDDGPGDREAFALFIKELSASVRALGKILTVDTFPAEWNGPNYNWWPDWSGYVDNIHTMGYDENYEGGTGWQKYSFQQNKSVETGNGPRGVLMGMPAWSEGQGGAFWGESSGRGTSNIAHVQEVRYNLPAGPTGITIWDMQLIGWNEPRLWCELKELRDISLLFGEIKAKLKADNQLQIDWSSYVEINSSHYDIEISKDSVNFKKIGTVNTKATDGNSNSPLHYSFSLPFSTTLFGSFGFGLLFIGFGNYMQHRRRRLLMYAAMLISAIIIYSSCKKSGTGIVESKQASFIRISQVDNAGKVVHSNIVRTVTQ